MADPVCAGFDGLYGHGQLAASVVTCHNQEQVSSYSQHVIPSEAEESKTSVRHTGPSILCVHPDQRDENALRGRNQRPRKEIART